ncbi:hypothetical protein ACS0TY_005032 [Phlomoides rotata]
MDLQTRPMQHAIATLIIFSLLVSQNLAQVQRQDCMNQLQPCLSYLNGKNSPPDSCCRPLVHVIKSMPECLCSLMTIQGANRAEQAGINVTDAQTLPGRCGQHINPLGCVTGTPDSRSRNSVPNSVNIKLGSSLNAVTIATIFVILLAL